MTSARQAARNVALLGVIGASLGAMGGCTSITTPKDAPDWYKNRVNEKSARRIPQFDDMQAVVGVLPTTPEWQEFADELARKRADLARRTAALNIPPDESVDSFRLRVQAGVAPGLAPILNEAPPVSPPRPLPAFEE